MRRPSGHPATRAAHRRSGAGFSLMELMIMVGILGIVFAVAVPKFAEMIRRANEGATVGKLSSIRSALAIYYADMEGTYPVDLTPMMTPGSKYLTAVIPVFTHQHGNTQNVSYYPGPSYENDAGGWGYVNNTTNAHWGSIWVDCTHTDGKGRLWTAY